MPIIIFPDNIQSFYAEIISPKSNKDHINEFYYKFFVKFQVVFTLYNVQNIKDIGILITSPDGKNDIYSVSENDILEDNYQE